MIESFSRMINNYLSLQIALVDLVIDGPAFIAAKCEEILRKSQRGVGLLDDAKIQRGMSDQMRVTSAVMMLSQAGIECKVDRVDGHCIWCGDEHIDFCWDVMNDEADHHPKFFPAEERNIDALVLTKDVFDLLKKNKVKLKDHN